ncbi:MAG: copper resistance protein NlpE N-terminal domain-containing protein [Arenimonas sp.]|jgi:copper homeostasis protein (lipoprotein)
MDKRAWLIVLLMLLLAACNRGRDDATGRAAPPPAPSGFGNGESAQTERTWVGLLPCSDCQGIDTRLVLRAEGGRRDYLMTETYLGGPGKNTFNRAGTWTEVTELVDGEPVTMYILDPDRAGQRFSLQPDGALELLEGDARSQGLAYRLQRL